ncbi:MAG: putative porin [Bacteroidales bacterium]
MKKIKFAIIGLLCVAPVFGQNVPGREGGSESTDTAPAVPMKVTSWKVDPLLGNVSLSAMDTLTLNYQNQTVMDGEGFNRGITGPMGSPTFSRYIFDQEPAPAFMFLKSYGLYNFDIQNTRFYNTTVPLSNLTYFNSGNRQNGEDRFKAFFTVNAGSKINFGGDFDMIYAKGIYNNNSAKKTNFRMFGSYVSDRYSAYGALMSSNMSNKENGGIVDDAYILDPASIDPRKKKFQPRDIPTNLSDNYTRVIHDQYFFTQRYNLGFEKELKDSVQKIDTVVFVPVTSFIHTFDFQKNFKRYVMDRAPENKEFYDNYYFDANKFSDFTRNWRLSNTVGISLREGFNRFMKFGLTGYAQFTTERYELMNPEHILAPEAEKGTYRETNRYTESTLYVGGQLLKTQGEALRFDINARFGVVGHNAGDVDIRGNIGSTFPLFGKDFYVNAEGYFLNKAPNFYYDQWISNNFIWNNSFKFEQRIRALAEIGLKQWDFSLKAGVENISNHIYFNEKSLPVQDNGNVQVVTATLAKNFTLGAMHIDNMVTYQKSSNQKVMPLPDLMLYHNLYFQTAIAKVLKIQVGADLRYWSSYYSPTYQPATNMFVNQQETKVGNYPLMNVYVNFHLKRARFFVMAYNVNEGLFGGNKYFAMPNYPLNPRMFKFGLSWNFLN